MKVVVAYVDEGEFEAIREELLGQGISAMSVSDSSGSLVEPTVTGTYRGTAIETHLRTKVRIECVAGDEQVATIADVVLSHEGRGVFGYVVGVEQTFGMSLGAASSAATQP